ncbi:MAG: hypothetical protein M3021_08965 [Actinomycetota bacterium]|nr:hypothetical protein [Actinomycetota bacterium]
MLTLSCPALSFSTDGKRRELSAPRPGKLGYIGLMFDVPRGEFLVPLWLFVAIIVAVWLAAIFVIIIFMMGAARGRERDRADLQKSQLQPAGDGVANESDVAA